MIELLFHAPCFDGLCSAVLAKILLEETEGPVVARPVDYTLRDEWLTAPRKKRFAVVDFLYHPDAFLWADHHPTAFLTDDLRQHALLRRSRGERVYYDAAAQSCCMLLWELLPSKHKSAHLQRLVQASTRTDAAVYASPAEALFGKSPELRISRALGAVDNLLALPPLLHDLENRALEDVAEREDIRHWLSAVDRAAVCEVERIRRSARVRNGVVVYQTEAEGRVPARYAPYAVFPDANYSVVVAKWAGGAKITAMRNPWKEFDSVPIGILMSRWGGGGHRRVGSVVLRNSSAAYADEIVEAVAHTLGRGATE